MKFLTLFSSLLFFLGPWTLTPLHAALNEDLKLYRELSLSVRKSASLKIVFPDNHDMLLSYELDFAEALSLQPLWSDFKFNMQDPQKFTRTFYDRIFLKEGSRLMVGDTFLPLTCIFIKGQDNRYSGIDSPLFPELLLKVYLVANDYSCTGPLNPAWPSDGGKEETWDTFLTFTVKDPTIMQPIDLVFRYRWNEFNAVLIK